MKKRFLLLLMLLPVCSYLSAQDNIHFTNPEAAQVLAGNYNPADYAQTTPVTDPHQIVQLLNSAISPDSLKAYLHDMVSFHTRHTASDTLSPHTGIGAARAWALKKFAGFSSANQNRLVVSYLSFEQDICGVNRHKNILAILPGSDLSDKSVVIIEGHIDSRCEGRCDSACYAPGAEDNGSGSALVLELARAMAQYTFPRTIVFMLTIGEEQGLMGANAFAKYVQDNSIPVQAVLNNDVIGGIICGETASPPGCPGLNHIDSTNVRIFSHGSFNSKSKALARYVKLQYRQELLPYVQVPMNIHIMAPEDRTGRGGDHIPFRQRGYAAIRFTAANEHGDAGSLDPDYHDRQHTTEDILGVDTDNDGKLDSFFVDFNYLARNAAINGTGAVTAAYAPYSPSITVSHVGMNRLLIDVTDSRNYGKYLVGLRSDNPDFDTLIVINKAIDTIHAGTGTLHFVSVAAIDEQEIESLFSDEKLVVGTGIKENAAVKAGIELLPNVPNPFDEATWINIMVHRPQKYTSAFVQITDMSGKIVQKINVKLDFGLNEVLYRHKGAVAGTYTYSLVVDGQIIDTKKMVARITY